MLADKLFNISIGRSNDLNALKQVDKSDDNAVAFVSRTRENNGVTAYVDKNTVSQIYHGQFIAVPMVGNSCLATIQNGDFCVSQNMALMRPWKYMTLEQMAYYALCIEANAFRYSYGRPLSLKELKKLSLPSKEEIPDWVYSEEFALLRAAIHKKLKPINQHQPQKIDTSNWQWFNITDLFDIEEGRGLSLREYQDNPGNTPVLTATTSNNGISCKTSFEPRYPGNQISMTKDGEPGVCFYQPDPFVVSSNVYVLTPKNILKTYLLTAEPNGLFSEAVALFLLPLLELNKIKYNYGRKLTLERIKTDRIKLPVDEDGKVDLEWMREFVVSNFDYKKDRYLYSNK